MEIKGIHLHRADGTVDEYPFPICECEDEEDTGTDTGGEDTGGDTGGDSGGNSGGGDSGGEDNGGDNGDSGGGEDSGGTNEPEVIKTLYIYKSRNSDFSNCEYYTHTNNKVTILLPPWEAVEAVGDASLGSGIMSESDDCVAVYYVKAEAGDYSYLIIRPNTTFADYSKLYIEANGSTNNRMRAGYYTGADFLEENFVYETLCTDRKVYEFDISDCTLGKGIGFRLYSEEWLYIYNIWLET